MEGRKFIFMLIIYVQRGYHSIYMIISFVGKLPRKLLILSSDCIEVTLDYCLWCLFSDTKNNKYGFSCLKFFVVAVGISVSLWINYLNIWNTIL